MISGSEEKYIRSIQQKKFRELEKMFIAEGSKLVLDAMRHPEFVSQIVALPEWIDEHIPVIGSHPFLVKSVNEKTMAKISALQTPSPVLAVLKTPDAIPADNLSDQHFYFALDGIRDPGNLGTIIRIADWFGFGGVFCSPDCVDAFNPKTVQASMGSILRVGVSEVSLISLFENNSSKPVIAAALEGENIFSTQIYSGGIVLIGSEGSGINEILNRFITKKVTIAGTEGAESLNASVAAGIIASVLTRNTFTK